MSPERKLAVAVSIITISLCTMIGIGKLILHRETQLKERDTTAQLKQIEKITVSNGLEGKIYLDTKTGVKYLMIREKYGNYIGITRYIEKEEK